MKGLARRRFCAALACGAAVGARAAGPGVVHEVGPGRRFATIAEAARVARDGDTVEVQAGEYRADVTIWAQRQLLLRAVGGRVRLLADGASAEGKGIWVVRGGDIRVEGFDFEGARAAARNGAGIRFEKGRLAVVDCRFRDNENGILTASDRAAELVVERSLFQGNGSGDGQSHNLYVGRIAALTVTDSAFHDARGGHLLKSRAARSEIHRNQLTDSDAGQSSYELELPNGGLANVTHNRLRQGPATTNSAMVSYGAEGYPWPENRLVLHDNLLIDDRPAGGIYLRVAPGERQVELQGNRLEGASRTRARELAY